MWIWKNYKQHVIDFEIITVLKSDTGGLVEYTKVIERIMLKELGKITS